MPVTNENFDQLKIDKLKHFLEDMAAKGQPRPFEIFVDSLKVVPKTEDPKDFDAYEYYINEDTEKIRILIYNSNLSPRNDQYCFYLQKNKTDKSLNGLGDIDNLIQEKIAARDREHEAIRLKNELESTQKQLAEAEEYIEELEQKLSEATDDKYKLKNINLIELGTTVLGKLAERHADVLAKAGLEGFGARKPELPSQPEGEASFQKKSEAAENLSEDQKRYISFLSSLEQVFNHDQLDELMKIIQKLSEEPVRLNEVSQLLNIQN